MASLFRAGRPICGVATKSILTSPARSRNGFLTAATKLTLPSSGTTIPKRFSPPVARFHGTARRGQNESDEPPPTDFAAMDVLGNTPVPSTAVDICMSDGFQLNSGAKILDGSGVILVGGEAFKWQPWLPRGEHRLLNAKGQWDIPNESLGLLSLLWPRPGNTPYGAYIMLAVKEYKTRTTGLTCLGATDLLILGLGPEIRPISPELRRHISSLGMRVEVLDTRNAAAQFNLLATERGVNDVAAALIPIGWREGIGTNW